MQLVGLFVTLHERVAADPERMVAGLIDRLTTGGLTTGAFAETVMLVVAVSEPAPLLHVSE
ncbi:hypothetical protein IPP92_01670 [Candidatus Saccharibacteria bacterium]|nr:MAG: hypothetical protein IPP92_01670 [Candidatus Saccharibacteria bacterium]